MLFFNDNMRPIFLTSFALFAFAFNSILCRAALGSAEADASGFTAVRLVSGAIVLAAIFFLTGKTKCPVKTGNWASSLFLFIYAICFSFAYLGLTTGAGALILFGCVQMTMIGSAIVKGELPGGLEWLGLVIAVGGLVYLVFPGLSAPPLVGSLLMGVSGIAWGFYSLRGKKSDDALADTAGNFVRSVPFALIAAIPFLSQLRLSSRGIVMAVLSGAVASGLGYTAWYAALKYHSSTRAAVLQLAVPLIAALGGVLFLSESADLRLGIASVLILGGIAVTIIGSRTVQ